MRFITDIANNGVAYTSAGRRYNKSKTIFSLVEKIKSLSDRINPHFDNVFSRQKLKLQVDSEFDAKNRLYQYIILVNKIKPKYIFWYDEESYLKTYILNDFYQEGKRRKNLTLPYNEAEKLGEEYAKSFAYAVTIVNYIVRDNSENNYRYYEMCSNYIDLMNLLCFVNNIGKIRTNGILLCDYLGVPCDRHSLLTDIEVYFTDDSISSPIMDISVGSLFTVRGQLAINQNEPSSRSLSRLLINNTYTHLSITKELN